MNFYSDDILARINYYLQPPNSMAAETNDNYIIDHPYSINKWNAFSNNISDKMHTFV